METLIGLAMFTGQIMGIIIVFGGWKKCPQWMKVCIGIAQILMIFAVIGMADKMP